MKGMAVLRSIALTGAVAFAGACGGVEGEQIETSTQGLSTFGFYDSTGKVHIELKICDWSPYSQNPLASCAVGANHVLVGGGAEVEGSASGGGLLWASYPAGQTWFALSKDQVTPYSHRLRAYSVGMQLAGMDYNTLKSLVTTTYVNSGTSNLPTASAVIPVGHSLLSGGGFTQATSGAGVLMTESYPSGTRTWTVSGKEHQQGSAGAAGAYALSIPTCLNNLWSGGCLNVYSAVATSPYVGSGYGMATLSTPAGYVPLGVGGRARWSGQGRLLTDIFPLNSVGSPGATAYSKDHIQVDGNVTDVWALSIKGN